MAEAHRQTLQWVLQPSDTEQPWDNLPEWLKNGSDIYWVRGKPGSGKSTLMKFLYQHSQVHRFLQEWANGHRLITPNFFFCYLGTPEQRTHEGLLRGLLHSILAEESSLIPNLLPGMCRDAHKTDKTSIDIPSLAEMRKAFSRLKNGLVKTKICFFH